MPSRRSRDLVIDASVATSAGERGRRGEMCQSFLSAMIDRTVHRLVMTKQIGMEWDRHSHPIARRWRKKMIGMRRVVKLAVDPDHGLAERIELANQPEKALDAMKKDMLLIDAARATDRRIVSLDDRARGYFSKASCSVGELGEILWVNPASEDERPVQWLEDGAPEERPRMISSFS